MILPRGWMIKIFHEKYQSSKLQTQEFLSKFSQAIISSPKWAICMKTDISSLRSKIVLKIVLNLLKNKKMLKHKLLERFLFQNIEPCFHIRVIYGIWLFWHMTMPRRLLVPLSINFYRVDDFTLTNDLDKSPIMHIFMEMQKRSAGYVYVCFLVKRLASYQMHITYITC